MASLLSLGEVALEMLSFQQIDPTTGRENMCPPLFYLISLPDITTFSICEPDKHITQQSAILWYEYLVFKNLQSNFSPTRALFLLSILFIG